MKPLLQSRTTIVALILLAVAGFPAGAQGQGGRNGRRQADAAQADTLIARTEALQAPDQAESTSQVVQRARALSTISRNISTAPSSRDSENRVLVVPKTETTPEQLASLTEDLNIMALIFDKKLKEAGINMERRSSFLSPNPHRTGVLHLQGHGPIFMLRVNFPLTPPPEAKSAEGTDKSVEDPLWLEMKYQLGTGSAPWPNMVWRRDLRTMIYQPDRVEKLKKTLIQALSHASNIRNLDSAEKLTITIQGAQPRPGKTNVGLLQIPRDAPNGPNTLVQGSVQGMWSPDVLTIRARKVDIDAFAEGKISSDEFAKKVEVFTSYRSNSDHGPMLSFTSPLSIR